MDIIYALVIIMSGTLIPEDGTSADILSGEVENRTTVYFRTMESCEAAYQQALGNKESMLVPDMNVNIEVLPCEGIQVAE